MDPVRFQLSERAGSSSTCPWCREATGEPDPACVECRTRYHPACLEELLSGRAGCGTPGCASQRFERGAPPASTIASAPGEEPAPEREPWWLVALVSAPFVAFLASFALWCVLATWASLSTDYALVPQLASAARSASVVTIVSLLAGIPWAFLVLLLAGPGGSARRGPNRAERRRRERGG